MFELDENGRFLTKSDLVLACLYNSEVREPLPYQNVDRYQANYMGVIQHLIRQNVSFLGWVLEENSSYLVNDYNRIKNYYRREHFGHHITDDVYLVSVHYCETNINYRNQNETMSKTKPTYLFSGKRAWGQMQFESQSGLEWWFAHFKKFRQMGQIQMVLDEI